VKHLGTKDLVYQYLKSKGCSFISEIKRDLSLPSYMIFKALKSLERDGLVQKFPVNFSKARHIGQIRLFGRRIGKYLYYTDRESLISFLSRNLNPKVFRPKVSPKLFFPALTLEESRTIHYYIKSLRSLECIS